MSKWTLSLHCTLAVNHSFIQASLSIWLHPQEVYAPSSAKKTSYVPNASSQPPHPYNQAIADGPRLSTTKAPSTQKRMSSAPISPARSHWHQNVRLRTSQGLEQCAKLNGSMGSRCHKQLPASSHPSSRKERYLRVETLHCRWRRILTPRSWVPENTTRRSHCAWSG